MDREDALRGGFEAPSHSAARITPDDVQRKEFGTARMRVGYLMHEVDEFLDEITDTLSALLSENERLRAQVAGAPGPSAAPQPAAARPADRAAVEAFLQREKAFLQDLGSLVQGHAEELRGMVRSARQAPTSPAGDRPAGAATAGERPAPAVADASAAATSEPAASAASPAEIDVAPTDEAPAGEADDRDEAADVAAILGTDDADTRALEAVEAEEPIVVDEPEPTGTRRRDDPAEGSLRELFWGEE